MVKNIFFSARDGQTPLPAELYKDLIPKHIQTMRELDECEEENILNGVAWMMRQTQDWTHVSFWFSLHQHLFSDVWRWAGLVRTYELQNENFLKVTQIFPALKELEGNLNYWLKEHSSELVAYSCRFHERLITIHPFPNGNGRFSRILTEHYCKKSNIDLPTWGKDLESDPPRRRKAYIDALRTASLKGNYSPLQKFMYSNH
jgi:Fic-DOC domain mobile mystery protein B